MRQLLLIPLLVFPWVGFAADRSYIQEYYSAQEIEKADPAGALEGMMRSYRLAIAAGNADYATSAGLGACYLLHGKSKTVETGLLAREVLDAIDPLPTNYEGGDALRRAQLFGFLETGLLMEGKTGEAWRANRATAETLRDKKVSANADGPSITLSEVSRLRPDLRGLGWRIIVKESELLDVAGRSNEARKLLDDAAASMGDDWLQYPANERFYAFKLLAARAMMLDFLGYEEEAILAQRKLEDAGNTVPILGCSHLILRLNLLRNLSQWSGPTEEILNQARELDARLKADGNVLGAGRTLAKMELDLQDSNEALEALRTDSKNSAALGHHFDSLYSDRDLLVARAGRGETDLDGEFKRLLKELRAQGNKRGEPSIYREYGDYLLDGKRPAEAIAMFTEALRLTRSFGLTLHEPGLLQPLFNARFDSGDIAGARAVLGELESFIAAHPDMPVARRVSAEADRAVALGRLGERAAAHAALELARNIGVDLPAYQKRRLTPEAEAAILKSAPAGSIPAPAAHASPVKVQPLEVVSIAPVRGAARTRFTAVNASNVRIEGQWRIEGPGALETSANEVRFDAGKPVTKLVVPRAVGAGGEATLAVILSAAAGMDSAAVTVAWETSGQAAGPSAIWSVRWEAGATGSIVLDASSLESNPFCFVPLFHELAVPLGEDLGVPFRLRSPVPLRFEYYDARSQKLLAIDANGNGDFTEPGDLHVRGPSGLTPAIVPVAAGERVLTVEVHIFAPDGRALMPGDKTILLEAEVNRNGVWTMEAQDTLK